MSLADRISARTRRPTITLRLDGRLCRGVLSAGVDQALSSNIARGSVVLRDPPVTPTPGMSIRWSWGYDGFEVPAFTGFVVTPEVTSYPNVWTLECQDVLWRAQLVEQTIVTSPLNSISAQDAIAYILATYGGAPNMSIPPISLTPGGPAWVLGTLTPVRWERATALGAAVEIAAAAGYWLFADAGGTVRARAVERRPSDSPFRVLTKGDAAGATLLVQGAPRRRQPGDQVKNLITVRGANTGVEGAQLVEQFLATHALYPGVVSELEFSSSLLEDIDDLTAVAERLAALWNRVPDMATARIKADPRLQIGMTIAIQDASLGFGTARPFFIYSLATRLDVRRGAFDQEITLDGGTGDAGFTTLPPPIAVISYRLEREYLSGSPAYLVALDGTGSYTLDAGEIVSYAWATSDPVWPGTPNSGSTPLLTLLFPETSDPADISLTVTATNSKQDAAALSINLAGDSLTPATTEVLNVAFGAAQQATPDGGQTWNADAQTTTRVPPVGAGVDDRAPAGDGATYGILAAGDQEIRQSLDVLATAPTLLDTASGAITALSVNVANGSRVWRAVGPLVQRSTDGGATWTNWGTPLPGTNVLDIIEDPAVNDSVFALAGANMYHSTASPGAWGLFYAGPVGSIARWIQRSISGDITWICYADAGSGFTGSPLQRVEGPIGVTFPSMAPDPEVTEIRAIALNDMLYPAAPQLVAIDQESRIWVIDALTGAIDLQSAATFPAGTIVQHAQHSYKAPVAYVATFDSEAEGTGAVYKYLPQSDSLLLMQPGEAGQQAHMVGIGGAGAPPPFRLLLITTGLSAGTGGVYEHVNGAWVLRSTGLPSAVLYGEYIAANPFNANQWIALFHQNEDRALDLVDGKVVSRDSTDSPWWYWDGTSFQEIVVNAASLPSGAATFQVEWTSNGQWIVGWQSGSTNHTTIIRGTGTTPGAAAVNTNYSAPWLCDGQSGEIVVVQSFKAGDEFSDLLHYLTAADVYTTPAGSSPGELVNPLPEREPSGRGIVTAPGGIGTGSGALYATPDYRTTQLVSRGGSGIRNLTWATHGLYTSGGGFTRITNPLSGTVSFESVLPDYFGSTTINWVRCDRQSRSIVGIVSDSDRVFVYDGTSATLIPTPISQANLANRIEVLT